RYRVLSNSFGYFLSNIILMIVPLFIVASLILYFVLGVELPSILNIICFLISALLSFVITDGLGFLLGELAIFTNALFGLMLIKNITFTFLSGSLFPEWLQNVLKFLPFQSM